MARWHALWLNPVPREIEPDINIERLVTIAHHQPVSALAHAVNTLILAYTAWSLVPHNITIAFASVIVVVATLQIRAWYVHRNRRPKNVTDRTITKVVLSSAVFGALWGGWAATVLMFAGAKVSLLIAMVMAGMIAGGTMMLYCVPAALLAFLAFSMIPVAVVRLTVEGRGLPSPMADYVLVYLTFVLLSARFSHGNFIESAKLRLQNFDLANKAEEASRAKSRFLANMSHELRTPLNAIIGFAEVIHNQFKGPVGNPQYVEFARSIHHSGRHLVGIINDILDLSKAESGQVALDEEVAAIAAIADRATMLMRHAAETAQIQLDVAIDPTLPHIFVDARKIDQVMVNLISNSIKFTPAGGRVKIGASLQADGDIAITITDTGVGIPADELSEVMKPFVQSRDAERRRVQGTGLGLPLADQYVKLHGGTLSLTSAPGAGTTATIILPALRVRPRSPL